MHVAHVDVPERCQFENKLFTTLGDVAFRRSDADGMPIMSVNLGYAEASIPLASLRRDFSIGDDTPDGRMLDLVGSALDFVLRLQPGDKLPSEVRTGEASWQPSTEHVAITAIKLRLRLVIWHSPMSPWAKLPANGSLPALGDADFQQHVDAATAGAGAELGLDTAAQVAGRLDDLTRELSYIAALHDRLLTPVEDTVRRCEGLAHMARSSTGLQETVSQVVRLINIAHRQIRTRFDDLDGQTGEIINALRNIESQRRFIRANRDWLYRNQRAWDTLLQAWRTAPPVISDATAALLTQTYRFLAPRFMPAKDWHCDPRAKRK